MWTKILEFAVIQILLPLLKDLAFMLFNVFKVRKIRKQIEEEKKKKAEEFKNAKTPEEVSETFGQLGISRILNLIVLLFFSWILLVSCTHQDITTPDDPQCSPIFVAVKDDAGIEWISTSESYCICRKYRMSLNYIGMVPGTQTWKEPIMSCNKVVGWKPDGYGNKSAFWEKVRVAIKDKIDE